MSTKYVTYPGAIHNSPLACKRWASLCVFRNHETPDAAPTAFMLDRTKTNVREIKLIVDGHFVWTIYKTKNGSLDSAGGGTYTLAGDTYVEHLDFGSPRLGRIIDQSQKFSVKLEGDRLIQTGVLSDGTELQEIWQRVTPK